MLSDKEQLGASSAAPDIKATIVIPTLNEGRDIARALDGIIDNGFPLQSMRVLIIDGGSKDDTVKIIQEYCAKWPRLFELIVDVGATVYQAVKFALELTRSEYFLRVDARSFIPRGYIAKCIDNLQREGVVGAGGVQKQVGTSPVGRAVALATSHPFGVGNASFRLGRASGCVDTVYLGAYRTADLRRVGGFDAAGRFVSEDSSINARLRESGGRIYLDADLKVQYPAKENLRALAKQYLIYGAAKGAYFLAHRKLTSIRQALPILYLLTTLAAAIAAPFYPPARIAVAVLVLMYVIPNVAISAWLARAYEHVAFRDLTRVFAAMHFSYLFGFLGRIALGEMPLSRLLRK